MKSIKKIIKLERHSIDFLKIIIFSTIERMIFRSMINTNSFLKKLWLPNKVAHRICFKNMPYFNLRNVFDPNSPGKQSGKFRN